MFTPEAKGNMNKKTVGAHLKLLMQGTTAFRGAPNERKSAFPPPGTAGFLKKACSRGREQAKTKKMSVPACGNEEK